MVQVITLVMRESNSSHIDHHALDRQIPNAFFCPPSEDEGLRFRTPACEQPKSVQLLAQMLSIYPIAHSIIRHLDLMSLFSTSSLCKATYAALLMDGNRKTLAHQTLRCHVEQQQRPRFAGSDAQFDKTRRCYRGLVRSCARCALPVCRSCASKPPGPPAKRFRQLCRLCQCAPPPADACLCAEDYWLCVACHRAATMADAMHRAQLRWRQKYSALNQANLGMGQVSFSQAHEGIRCGAGVQHCLGKFEMEVERAQACSPGAEDGDELLGGVGYDISEMEGIGGSIVSKAREMVVVAGHVEDDWTLAERYGLSVAQGGGPMPKARGWCSWCDRVIPEADEVVIRDMGEAYPGSG